MWSRWTRSAWKRILNNAKDPGRPLDPIELYAFTCKESLDGWQVFSDEEYGGTTRAQLVFQEEGRKNCALFRGILRSETKEESLLSRSGFCGMRSTTVGSEYLSMDACNVITFDVYGDGRRYIASIRTDNWIAPPGSAPDLWQAVLAPPSGTWKKIRIPLEDFLLTWKGKLVDTAEELPENRVLSLGIAIACEPGVVPEGPFELRIRSITAERDLSLI